MLKTVAIVGLAPTTSHLVAQEPPGIEVWGLNQGHALFTPEVMGQFTRWFQVHPWEEMVVCQNPELEHLEFLRTTHLPVYLEELNPEGCPNGVRYPYEEVCQTIGGTYLTSAPAYMLALAIHEGFQRINVYGVDMANATEYQDQRPCFEFLLGMALARGIQVWLPPGCPLLKGPLYAKTVYVTTSTIQQRLSAWLSARDQLLAQWHEYDGRVQAAQELLNLALKGNGGQGAANIELSQADNGELSLVENDRLWDLGGSSPPARNGSQSPVLEFQNTPPIVAQAEALIKAVNSRSHYA